MLFVVLLYFKKHFILYLTKIKNIFKAEIMLTRNICHQRSEVKMQGQKLPTQNQNEQQIANRSLQIWKLQ